MKKDQYSTQMTHEEALKIAYQTEEMTKEDMLIFQDQMWACGWFQRAYDMKRGWYFHYYGDEGL